MRLLDLFSGSCVVSRIAQHEFGLETISLDWGRPADIQEDVMTWDYRRFPPGHFDVIAASPDCKVWSQLRTTLKNRYPWWTKERIAHDIETIGKPMVDKVREIITYFQPRFWWIENPRTGKMKTYITDLPFVDVDYCRYGLDRQKPTRLWTNVPIVGKECNDQCGGLIPGTRRHRATTGFRHEGQAKEERKTELEALPEPLVLEMLRAAS